MGETRIRDGTNENGQPVAIVYYLAQKCYLVGIRDQVLSCLEMSLMGN